MGDQQAFIAWTVHQISRGRGTVVAWERFVLGSLLAATSAGLRIVGLGARRAALQHEEQQAQLDAFNDYAFGDER